MKNKFTNTKFGKLDGRHKLAIVGSLVCWVLSMYFSYLGFKVDNPEMVWIGWILAGIVTVVELVFNSQMSKLPLTLFVVGILCYGYGIWTNVVGFWSLQHPGDAFAIWNGGKSVMSWFVGSILEVLPEPLFMWGIMANIDGDFLGNIAGWWNGDLEIAKPGETTHQNRYDMETLPESIKKLRREGKEFHLPVTNSHKTLNQNDLFPEILDTESGSKPKSRMGQILRESRKG